MTNDTTRNLKEIPFDCDSYTANEVILSFLDSGGSKPPLHLYHANGFPISVYLPFMTRLTEHFRVVGLGLRGQDQQAPGNTSWPQIARDLIHFLDEKQIGPVLGVGHSVGGVATMMAAVERPDLFSKIILIDPVILSSQAILSTAWMRLLGKRQQFPPAAQARARRNHWADRYEFYDYLKTKSLFRNFDDTYLRSYVTYGAKPSDDGGIELLCPPEAEARIYENYPLDVWSWIKRLNVPALIIRGEHSDVLTAHVVNLFCRKAVNAIPSLIEGTGHLIPMEKPDELIAKIRNFSGILGKESR